MKIVSPQQMADIETKAMQAGASASDFMEEAGSGIALIVHDYIENRNLIGPIILLCGKGNNAGDAYVAGTHLLHLDYEVLAVQPIAIDQCSELCRSNWARFKGDGGRVVDSIATFPPYGLIIDGIFGTGFRGAVEEPFKALIQKANNSRLPIIAIDIPSGLNGDTGECTDAIIATETAFLGLPKKGFFFNQGWNHTGKLRHIHFGLDNEYLETLSSNLEMLSEESLKPKLPTIVRSRHKYQAGYVVGLAGSPGMAGAAMLSSAAALRSGAGIVRLFHPEGMHTDFVSSPYELIRTAYQSEHIEDMVHEMNRASAVFIGPGIGRSDDTNKMLRKLLPLIEKPCVIDADALTLLADQTPAFPAQTVLTPHHGEMAKLLNISTPSLVDMRFLEICREYATKHEITLVLKGAPTYVMDKEGTILINPTGSPGMATAGSGDVLTGLIAALLAQGMPLKDGAAMGAFLHGLAGEHAAEDYTPYCMMASDIIYRFPEAFRFVYI